MAHRCAVRHPRLSPLSRALVLPPPLPTRFVLPFSRPRSFSILLSCSRHRSSSPSLFGSHPGPRRLGTDCAKCISPFVVIFFYRPLANVRKINCRPARSEMHERRARRMDGRMKRMLAGGCRFYAESDFRVGRYVDDNSIKRLRQDRHLCVSMCACAFFFLSMLSLLELRKYASIINIL